MAIKTYTELNPPPEGTLLLDDNGNELSLGCMMEGYADGCYVTGELFAVRIVNDIEYQYGLIVYDPEDFVGHDLNSLLCDTPYRKRGWWVRSRIHLISGATEVSIPEEEIENLFDF